MIRQEIWSAIARLKRDSGLAILVIDKSLAELAHVADRAVILDRGSTVWSGTFGALTRVSAIDGKPVGPQDGPGPVTLRLRKLYAELVARNAA